MPLILFPLENSNSSSLDILTKKSTSPAFISNESNKTEELDSKAYTIDSFTYNYNILFTG